MENEVMLIKMDDIVPNRFQPREVFNEEELNKLADSIRQHGVIEPIIVRPVSNKFEIIAGERRYKASILAGLTTIPALVKQLDDKQSSIIAYIENEHRADVSAIEEAKTIDRILKNNDMTQDELSKELGISQSSLANKLRLLSLPIEVQESLMRNEISERHARSLLSVKETEKQLELLNRIKEKRMTVRELDNVIKEMNGDNNMNENIAESTDNRFVSFLNNYETEKDEVDNVTDNLQAPQDDAGFMDFLNNYDNNNPVPEEPQEEKEDSNFMNFLNNYDSNNPVPEEPQEEKEDSNFMNFLNNYDNNNPVPEEPQESVENLLINDVTPPITSNFNANSYVEDNPNYIDVSKAVVIDNVDDIINKLKSTIDDIKGKSKFKIDTDEINFDDIYQITIKIDKRDF